MSETMSTMPQMILLKIKFYCHVQVPVQKDPHPQFLRMKECPNVYILYQQGTKIGLTSLYLVTSLVTLFALIKVSQKDPTYPSRPKKPDLFRVRSDTSTPESKGGVQSQMGSFYSITGTYNLCKSSQDRA